MGVVFYLVLGVVAVLVLFFLAVVHAGYFYALRIRTSIPLSLPGRVAYKLHKGSYTNAGPAFKELASLAPRLRTFSIYYDDPRKVPQAELRYIVGSYLENGSKSEAEVSLQNAGYKVWVFPKCSNAVMTEFPNRSMLSIILAPNCVYPALEKYFKSNNLKPGPVVELCQPDCIRYIAPLEHNEDFYVPEVADIAESRKDR